MHLEVSNAWTDTLNFIHKCDARLMDYMYKWHIHHTISHEENFLGKFSIII